MIDKINIPEFEVSEFNQAFKEVIESNFNYIRIKGEISEVKTATRGQIYLTLKDEDSILSGVIWDQKKKYLENMTLFVTLEPCTMCASAISEVHIKNLYFGAYDEKNGGIEKLRVAFQRENIFMPTIYGGIMEKECSNLLKKFFKNKSDK